MYACLRMLMQEQDVQNFLKRQNTFISYWQPQEQDFVTYYKQEYSTRAGEH